MPLLTGWQRKGVIMLLFLILVGVAGVGIVGGYTLSSSQRTENTVKAIRAKNDRDECRAVIGAERQAVRDNLTGAKDDRDSAAYAVFIAAILRPGTAPSPELANQITTAQAEVDRLRAEIQAFPPVQGVYDRRCPKV